MYIHKRFNAHTRYPRIDHFLKESLPDISRTQIEKYIKDNRVKLNDKAVTRKNLEIDAGDVVEIELPQPEEKVYTPSFELNKLFEDEYIMIIDKPAGVSVHVGAGEYQETILDVFAFHYPQIKEISGTDRPGIVHRLDRDTSGILILAKDIVSMRRLQKQFKRRDISKTYLALVSGRPRFRSGTVNAPIMRSPRKRTKYIVADRDHESDKGAREAVTEYFVIREFGDFSFMRLMPHTGRTHQLRVHMSHLGHPILGDKVYGKASSFERLALHAYSIEFTHPVTGEEIISFSPFPPVFREFLKKSFHSGVQGYDFHKSK
jgi:23S rRNA pseudouridine1911/1915/1917 synthase